MRRASDHKGPYLASEPLIVRIASVIGACGLIATLTIAAAGLPGPVHGLLWDTSTTPGDSEVTIKVVAAVAAFFVAVLALGRFELSRNERHQATSALDYSEQTLYETQYGRAIVQLASPKELVQFGAIYSLDFLYRASPRHRAMVVRALCAFIRAGSPIQPAAGTPPVRTGTALAAIAVLRDFEDLPIGFELANADLDYVSMDGTQMIGSDFGAAMIRDSTLTKVDLAWSNLRGCDLSGTDLSGSNLEWCNLAGATVAGATFRDVRFVNTDLTGVCFTNADLTGANLQDATWDAGAEPEWPEGFSPPTCRKAMSIEELDAARKDYVSQQGDRRAHPGLRFSKASLREHEAHYRRLRLLTTAPGGEAHQATG